MSTKITRSGRLKQIRQRSYGEESDDSKRSEASNAATGIRKSMQSPQNREEKAKVQLPPPTIDPYVGKLERYELFCTNQSYYLVGCNKMNTAYRVLKMDRTLIERPADASSLKDVNQQPAPLSMSASTGSNASESQNVADAAHKAKPTLRPLSEFLTEDPNVYTQQEIQDMLDMIHDGNRLRREGTSSDGTGQDGGLKPIATAYGIVGFIRFLDCYYLTLITRTAKVGNIGGNGIYSIKGTETFPIKPADRVPGSASDMDIHADPSSVLLNMWNRGKRSVGLGLTNREIAELRYQGLYQVIDLTKNFYFSYTYDLTRSLQENFLSNTAKPFPPPPFKDMFAWNYFLTRELEGCCNTMSSFQWVMPIIHGAFIQRKLNDYGRTLNIILLARRSRHFAGTRYLKRGVSEQGKVANDVEHEQILHDESISSTNGLFSSFLQVRGSIPTFWTQESSVTMPKPPIELNRVDPSYTATQLHFEDLIKRYGSPIVVLDLVKQSEKREREVRVGNEYRHAIDYINTSIDDAHKIRYCALDYSHISKHRHLDVSTALNEVSTWAVNQTGFFCSNPQWKITQCGNVEPFDEQDLNAASVIPEQLGIPVFPMEQTGILRTNCIDCLDRTNVAQFSAGVEAMEQQLVVMGIRTSPNLDPSSNIVRVLIDMYVDIGDHIALQYGGSEAHKKVSTERNESTIVGPIGKHKELLTSIRRYYSNAFTDRLKQDAMNLFLGYYVPYRHAIPLWEMETDYYLHNFHVGSGRGSSQSMRGFQAAFGVLEWNDDELEKGTDFDKVSLVSSVHSQRLTHQRVNSRNTLISMDETALHEEQSRRIERVRNRCDLQNKALSVWWKIALQSCVQQRMWMQLGASPTESFMPPRFDRFYQPEKMAQFDRFFARPWATPVRRSHAAQHNGESDDENEVAVVRKNASGRAKFNSNTSCIADTVRKYETRNGTTTLQEYIGEHGFDPANKPSRKLMLQSLEEPIPVSRHQGMFTHNFVGETDERKEAPPEEYIKYARSSIDYTTTFRHQAFDEFKEALYPLSLSSNDVDGIQKLAESAHIGRLVSTGPYKGLRQDTSAIEVETVLQEQLNAYEHLRDRGELREGIGQMDAELVRRGFHTDGVKNAVTGAWSRHTLEENLYQESFMDIGRSSTRSDLTTANTFRLYSSFFPPHNEVSMLDKAFCMEREKNRDDIPLRRPESAKLESALVAKAQRLGIEITSHSELLESRNLPLFQFERAKEVPEGFEMINEDFFARKENKFMVFNGAGVDSWEGTKPVTKISGIASMLMGTLE
eukprot:Nitzschia sp. Nitz4//scaffold1_size375055//278359//282522//NITZ4_000307-RA/size375055-augustus-gene-0.689-mRNA-1//1//CDS//3329541138//8011//frame0